VLNRAFFIAPRIFELTISVADPSFARKAYLYVRDFSFDPRSLIDRVIERRNQPLSRGNLKFKI